LPRPPESSASKLSGESPVARLRSWLRGSGPQFRVGTLTYTRLGLFLLFFWLLWGDLIWTLMEFVFPASMPLQVDRLNLPREWISYFGVVGAGLNMVMVPVVGFRSDRTRTRWGRRIPYLLITAPFLCLFLSLIGFSDDIGAWIRASNWPAKLGISPVTAIIVALGALIVLYDVFNVFVNSIFWYLFRDVVPSAYLGRFMAGFRIAQALAQWVWGNFVFRGIETHARQIYVGIALLYLVGFGLMCLMVREGKYPPPTDEVKGEPGLLRAWHAVQTYARECFTHPLYIWFYIAQALMTASTVLSLYKVTFYLKHLHFTPEAYGWVLGTTAWISLILPLPFGWLVDKIHPMRGLLISVTLMLPIHFLHFLTGQYIVLGYTITPYWMFVSVLCVQVVLSNLNMASDVPLMMRIFPKKQFGQFSSANALVKGLAGIAGGFFGGKLIGWAIDRRGDYGYGYLFLWQGALHALALISFWVVYVYWKRAGSDAFKPNVEETLPSSWR
jgi:maltose/moltooligosaccharide transporter